MGVSHKAVTPFAGGAECDLRKKSSGRIALRIFRLRGDALRWENEPRAFGERGAAGRRQYPARPHGGAAAPLLARPGPVSAAAGSADAHMAQYYHFMVTIMSNLIQNES